jgi:membrane fusion protein (multidrug efflux system)
VLLELDDDEALLRVRQAEVQLQKAEAEHARAKSMREMGMLSDQEFEALDNDRHIRQAELDLAKLELSYTRVTSPFTGRVVRRHVDLGANVTPGTALVDVMDVTPLLALVHVPANRMGFVTPGQTVRIRLDSTGTDLEGVVRLVSPIVDPTTGTVKVTVEIRKYPPATRPGDFAQVRIVTARHADAVLVPSRAIFEEQGQSILFVVQDTKAVRRVVKPGFVDGESTEILEGVAATDLVVVKGQRDLRDGLPVEILEGPAHVLAKKAAADSAGGADTARAEAAPDSTS